MKDYLRYTAAHDPSTFLACWNSDPLDHHLQQSANFQISFLWRFFEVFDASRLMMSIDNSPQNARDDLKFRTVFNDCSWLSLNNWQALEVPHFLGKHLHPPCAASSSLCCHFLPAESFEMRRIFDADRRSAIADSCSHRLRLSSEKCRASSREATTS